jgi:hypothetical protein
LQAVTEPGSPSKVQWAAPQWQVPVSIRPPHLLAATRAFVPNIVPDPVRYSTGCGAA